MADVDEAFAALQRLDEQGLKALRLSGALWEELLREAISRAEKAEWLLGRLHRWAASWGLAFDLSKADARWNATHQRTLPILGLRYQVLLAEQGAELRKLRAQVESAYEGEQRATAWAVRERSRAENAEAECNALMAEIERLRAANPKGNRY